MLFPEIQAYFGNFFLSWHYKVSENGCVGAGGRSAAQGTKAKPSGKYAKLGPAKPS